MAFDLIFAVHSPVVGVQQNGESPGDASKFVEAGRLLAGTLPVHSFDNVKRNKIPLPRQFVYFMIAGLGHRLGASP
jgi:hypothetical protein